MVDEDDYHWAIQWRWNPNKKKSRRNPGKIKIYAHRACRLQGKYGPCSSIYLHIEIMKRTGIRPPSVAHCIVDHRDGDTFNLRRSNLRWATHSMNSRNLFGKEPYDLEELMTNGEFGNERQIGVPTQDAY